MARAHQLLGAPVLFGHRDRDQLPAFLIALVVTTVLAIGIKESAKFNATIVVIKVAWCCSSLGLAQVRRHGELGTGLAKLRARGFGGIGAGAAYIFFAYIGFDAVSTTAQEAKNPQRDLPIGIIVSLTICTLLYIGVAAVLTGMVPWQQVNIEAPIARAFARPQSRLGERHHHAGRAGRADQRDAGDVAGADPCAVRDGHGRAAAEEVLC